MQNNENIALEKKKTKRTTNKGGRRNVARRESSHYTLFLDVSERVLKSEIRAVM